MIGRGEQEEKALERSCIGCGEARGRLIYRQSFSRIDGMVEFSGYDVVVCARCGAGFADRVPRQGALDDHYRVESKYENAPTEGRESEHDKIRFEEIAALLAGWIPDRERRLLEIGCATGGLLARLRDVGFRRVEGLDPSPECARIAARLNRPAVTTGSLFDLKSDGRFGAIVAVGVFEHIGELDAALGRVSDALAPDGLVYAEVPDVAAFPDEIDAPYQQFSLEHVNFFSVPSLRNSFGRARFRLVDSIAAVRRLQGGQRDPVIGALFSKCVEDASPVHDDVSEGALRRYVALSEKADRRVRETLARATVGHRPILVWGVGTLTLRLHAAGAFEGVNIRAFVDSNPRYHGRSVGGIPIVSPDRIGEYDNLILICSFGFADQIEEQIRKISAGRKILRIDGP